MWTENWLDGQAQKVVIEAMKSSWRSVSSSVHQGSTPGPILFSILIKDLGHNGPLLNKSADDTKQEGVTDTSDSCARETSTGWRNGLTDISLSLTRASAKSHTRRGTAPGTKQIRCNPRTTSWKADWQRTCWTRRSASAISVPLQQRRLLVILGCISRSAASR